MTTFKLSSNDNSKSLKTWGWLSKIPWLLFLQGTISFQESRWEIELKYQPLLENKIFAELVQNVNMTEESIR
ncbi:MAG: hypothetical protein AB4372_08765 [Xenococcus sp. (in: cyanobacteria)]